MHTLDMFRYLQVKVSFRIHQWKDHDLPFSKRLCPRRERRKMSLKASTATNQSKTLVSVSLLHYNARAP